MWEAAEVSKGDVLAILDSDISVDPEELEHFLKLLKRILQTLLTEHG